MNSHRTRSSFSGHLVCTALAAGMLLLGSGVVLAADSHSDQMAPSKEMREKMATMHEQMAACLRSDKPLAECRQEMMKGCQEMMGGHDCSMMMGMGGMGKGTTGGGAHSHNHAGNPPATSAPK